MVLAQTRLENRESLFAELDAVKPTHVLDAAGVTGRPNIDWCETHQVETIRTNVIGTLNLAEACHLKGIHMTLYATGCIFEYDEKHPIGGPGFTEEDSPNFFGSFYSKTKAYMEDMLKSYNNVCILRVRMPISDDLNSRNFVTKIVKYDKVVNVPNSMTVLTDLLPISLLMAARKLTGTRSLFREGVREGREAGGAGRHIGIPQSPLACAREAHRASTPFPSHPPVYRLFVLAHFPGIYNFTNPGAISHNQILALYKKHVDPSYTWENFTVRIAPSSPPSPLLSCSPIHAAYLFITCLAFGGAPHRPLFPPFPSFPPSLPPSLLLPDR